MKIRLIILAFFICLSFFSFKKGSTDYEIIEKQESSLQDTSIGKALYEELCIQCHLGTGMPTKKVIPPLDGSDWLTKKRKESIHAVKYGLRGPITVNGKDYKGNMPVMGLNDQEVADVMNYIMTAWSNKQTKKVTVEEVASVKK